MTLKTNFNRTQKLTMAAIVGALLFNPMVVQVFDQYFKWVYTGISIACTVWVIAYLLKKIFTPEKVTVPKSTKKQRVKSSEYIES